MLKFRIGVVVMPFLILIALTTNAQNILWAKEVLDVSSEYSDREFSAEQILNEPDAMWLGNKKSNMWRPKSADKESFIMVSFEKNIRANQILILEGENPGAIRKILAYDADFSEHVLLELEIEDPGTKSGFLHQFIEETSFEIHAIRLIVDGAVVKGFNGIDAIGIANEKEPIKAQIKNKEDNLDHPNFTIRRLGSHINSSYVEHNPILSVDGKTLYFSRQFDPRNVGGENDPEDIWFAEWNEEKNDWDEAKNIGRPWNNSGPNFIASITKVDGQEVFILGNRYEEKEKMTTGVSRATRTKESFSNPIPIEIENDHNFSDHVDFFLVPGGNILLMSSEREDSFGKRDLYVMFKEGKEGDDWSFGEPIQLGTDINTFNEEESPFMTRDTRTMYFSSDGYKGYGGVDIYQTHRLDDTWTRWSAPVNMGIRVNGYGNDEYLSVSESQEHLFYSRSEDEDHADIFDIALLDDNLTYPSLEVDSTGSPGPLATDVNTSPPSLYEQLNSVNSGVSLQMRHVYFDVNSSYLRPDSEPELRELASFLIKRADLKIELSAHTDSRQSSEYNLWMSDRRAKSVSEYLVGLGVEAKNITSIGYGETRLLNNCQDGVKCSEDEHQQNRRVEVKFLKK